MGVTMWKLLTIAAILTCNPSLGQDGLSEDSLNSFELDKPLEDSLKRTYECPEYDIEFKGYDINDIPVPGVTNWRTCGIFCMGARDCKFWTFTDDFKCWLKSSDGGYKYSPGLISGAKDCPCSCCQ